MLTAQQSLKRTKKGWKKICERGADSVEQMITEAMRRGWREEEAAGIGFHITNNYHYTPDVARVMDYFPRLIENGMVRSTDNQRLTQHPIENIIKIAGYFLSKSKPSTSSAVAKYFTTTESGAKSPAIQQLQAEYAHLNANLAPLMAEVQRMNEIERHLAALGETIDWDRCDRVREEAGVPPTPFNTRPSSQ